MTVSAKFFAAALALAIPLSSSLAQDDSEVVVEGRALENVIVDRDFYVRLVAESRFTSDDNSLLAEDVNYGRFPSKLYDAQLTFASIDKFKITSGYSSWNNDQGLSVNRKSLTMRIPLNEKWSVYPRYLLHKEEDSHRNYYYLALGGWFANVYTYTQYGSSVDEDGAHRSQVYQYFSWQPKNTSLRLGASGYASSELDSNDISTWQGKAFVSFPIIPDLTHLHLAGAYTDYVDILQYNEYEASVYQAVGAASSLRLSYRYYEDSSELFSHSYSLKAKHYFHPRLGVHLGYRRYDHSDGADFDTVFGGFNLLI